MPHSNPLIDRLRGSLAGAEPHMGNFRHETRLAAARLAVRLEGRGYSRRVASATVAWLYGVRSMATVQDWTRAYEGTVDPPLPFRLQRLRDAA